MKLQNTEDKIQLPLQKRKSKKSKAHKKKNTPNLGRMVAIADLTSHLALIEDDDNLGANNNGEENVARLEEIRTTPLFSSGVQMAMQIQAQQDALPQYALMGMRTETYGRSEGEATSETHIRRSTNLVYANINAPWSTFICGSQGSGKSHTLSCMLENALLHPSETGTLSSPLTGLVLHYDKFTGVNTGQLCEAAYLSSKVPVRVLVAPSNFGHMERLYANMPGLADGAPKPKVSSLYFREDQLTLGMMKDLMAVSGEGAPPLYMEVVTKVLREMAAEALGPRGINFNSFKKRLYVAENLNKGQLGPLNMRLNLLESFLEKTYKKPARGLAVGKGRQGKNIWDFPPGSLTIIDLSCPFVDENDACSLFNICLNIFMERRNESGRVVALDEAHKFLTTNSREGGNLTDTLLSLIRQQRHLATRVIIATQEPTLSPSLLDLCNVTIVHRFSSPAWFTTLRGHLAGAAIDDNNKPKYGPDNLFSRIVTLKTGEALVFCPGAILDIVSDEALEESTPSPGEPEPPHGVAALKALRIRELGPRYVRVRIRKRVTADGGRSILAQN
ncbi:uncharacterized protein BDCG_01275 [Blastomyces dermatitidis ER-3]|uniref:AAA+ ATPase domain-containing protein n=1 Tax=Ajellomyces dermatitidis (strain ER-3 / ATCC MYA-2586) TaxID=559297 RepID=A0ABP2EMA5_AJEDR|nr:uncharacterized protein BDCG_01275 [Blastomyces dermatitidis ER-3]EEQ84470.1 hypothetical protein BDCG_01275 [Blastomyces dermatitidis ER-3]